MKAGFPTIWADGADTGTGGEPEFQEWCEMAMQAGEIENLIKAALPDAEVTIDDLAGDGDHYRATIVAEAFRGKSRVQQHQIVYKALGGRMGSELHALALNTSAPA